MSSAPPPTRYEWAGGADAFERLTHAFYARVREDDVLAPVFEHMPDDHPHHVAVWFAEVFGGLVALTAQLDSCNSLARWSGTMTSPREPLGRSGKCVGPCTEP